MEFIIDFMFDLTPDELCQCYISLPPNRWRTKAVIKGLWLNKTGNIQEGLFNEVRYEDEKTSKV